jgi:flagellar protein FlaG
MEPIVTEGWTAASPGTPRSADVRQSSASPRTGTATQPNEAQIRQAVEATNTALKVISSDLEFTIDDSTGKTVVRVIDSSTQQVIRQFPSEEMLAIARGVDRLQGVLLKGKA